MILAGEKAGELPATLNAVVLACVSVSMVIGVTLGLWRVRRAKHRWRAAEARSAWLQAREELFALLMHHHLTPQSRAFRALFRLQEFVLQHPGEYQSIATELRQALQHHPRRRTPVWFDEHRVWPPNVRETMARAFHDMARGCGFLAANHPSMIAQVARSLIRLRRTSEIRGFANMLPPSTPPARTVWLAAIRTECELIDGMHAFEALARELAVSPPSLTVVE